MRRLPLISAIAGSLALSACGGGSGQEIASASSSAPTATGTNTSTSTSTGTSANSTDAGTTVATTPQSYDADAITSNLSIQLGTGLLTSASNAKVPLSISYDATAGSYTVTAPTRSEAFSASSTAPAPAGAVRYQNGDDLLTLYTTRSGMTYRYVTLGSVQRSSITGSVQNSTFDLFAYGTPTSLAGIPRSGVGRYGVDLLGVSSYELAYGGVLNGSGSLTVDFGTNAFAFKIAVSQTALVTNAQSGPFDMRGGGSIGADGILSGALSFYGTSGQYTGGSLSGRFYGPQAQELGAVFTATGSFGSKISGTITGQVNVNAALQNTTLLNVSVEQPLDALSRLAIDQAKYTISPIGNIAFDPASPVVPKVSFTPSDQMVGTDPNFQIYRNSSGRFEQTPPVAGVPVTLSVYKVGSANSELRLTYMDFAELNYPSLSPGYADDPRGIRTYYVFGLETPTQALNGRTGTAHYEGVAYGTSNGGGGIARYEVRGSSAFDVSFGDASVQAAIKLSARDILTGAVTDVGAYSGSTRPQSGSQVGLGAGSMQLNGTSGGFGQLNFRFYGPTGEEIGGSFVATPSFAATGVSEGLTGIVAATRR